jgi:hypothetical protein
MVFFNDVYQCKVMILHRFKKNNGLMKIKKVLFCPLSLHRKNYLCAIEDQIKYVE